MIKLNYTKIFDNNFIDFIFASKVSFEVEIKVKECRKGPNGYSHRFYIKPVGLPDKVEVRMEVICECDCEHPTIYVSKLRFAELLYTMVA